jgi:hypothetical protein
MARKRNSSSRPLQRSEAALATQTSIPQSTDRGTLSVERAAAATVAPSAKQSKTEQPERFWLEAWFIALSRWLGSLQIAVIGLSLFALVLGIGTAVESWYSGRVAQELIYRTWWFVALLGVLWINIFFAAAKKYPWKKHQTGFLITHLGLLTMVAGGILNSLSGVDALLPMIDTADRATQQEYGLAQTSSRAIDKDEALLTVTRIRDRKEESQSYPFRPGSLVWRSDPYVERKVDPLLGFLDWLAYPLPRSWQADLGRGAQLEVLGYYPHARRERYSPAEASDKKAFPAVKFGLASQFAPMMGERWVAYGTGDQEARFGPAVVEMLGSCPPELLGEFQNPPSPQELGQAGQLVLRLGGETHRLSVDKLKGGAPVPLGKTGWKVQIKSFSLAYEDMPRMPAVEFELTAPDGRVSSMQALARFAGVAILDPDKNAAKDRLGDLQVWYHVPDYRYGESGVRGVLQFITGPGDKLYYRSFNSSSGIFTFEKAGEVGPGEQSFPIWKGMNWQVQISEYLPRAVARPRYVPENLRPGLEATGGITPAVRCLLTVGKDKKEFWVGQTDHSATDVSVGGESFKVGYNVRALDLGFEIKLLRAVETYDPGTQQRASYTSFVQLTDKDENILGEDRIIYMNQPLQHRGYKFFQSGYNLLELDQRTNKPISLSTFTVSYDPGLWLKYLGSTMLALGIACMFYMKAYFFKPRGRQATA